MSNVPAVRREHHAVIAELEQKGLVYTMKGGRKAIRFAGLLDLANSSGLVATKTQVLQFPNESTGFLAVVHAEALFHRDGQDLCFAATGTCGPQNANALTKNFPVEMAETRALGRAFKQGVNIGDLKFADELPDDDAAEDRSVRQSSAAQQTPARTMVREEPRQEQQNNTQQQQRQAAPALAVVPPNSEVPGSCQPATKEQLDRLVKLQAALGRPTAAPAGLSFDEAAAQIKQMAATLNERAKAGTR